MYYMCFEGVWFMGSSPTGPWTVASKVPGEIYEIPISSPAHNVTYVTVQEDDDDEWATFATAAMYTGVMIAWGCAVWGSGWYHPPYWGWGGGYPYYYPDYPNYGYGASYTPWNGSYRRSAVAYGPYGGAGVSSRYNPRTGTKQEYLKILEQGVGAWNQWREAKDVRTVDLSDVNFAGLDLSGANFEAANLARTSFRKTILGEATLRHADLSNADLSEAISSWC